MDNLRRVERLRKERKEIVSLILDACDLGGNLNDIPTLAELYQETTRDIAREVDELVKWRKAGARHG